MSWKHVRSGFPWSLAGRLTIWYAVSAFVLLAASTSFLYWALISNLDREDDLILADKAAVFENMLRQQGGDASLRRELEWESTLHSNVSIQVRILNDRDQIVAETPGMSASLPLVEYPRIEGDLAGAAHGLEVTGADGRSYRLWTGHVSATNHVILMALDRTYEESLLERYRRNIWLALVAGVLASAGLGFAIARQGLRPLFAIAKKAESIRSTTLDQRIETMNQPTEILTLARTFNRMLDRLEESFQRLAQFSADIAHELRNPVNNLRGAAEVALGKPRSADEYRQVLESCLEECVRLGTLIDNLLFLARAEDPKRSIQPARLKLADELRTLGDFYDVAAAEAGVKLEIDADAEIEASLDRTLFQRALGNLLTNAFAHTPPGGVVRVQARRAGACVEIEVADTGSGIEAAHLPHVFERFYRADAARATQTGNLGLGLAIVRSIAVMHGGSAGIESVAGRGTTVRLEFPCTTE
jgi:two-component system heavy metal sensor histidine kinase CusS